MQNFWHKDDSWEVFWEWVTMWMETGPNFIYCFQNSAWFILWLLYHDVTWRKKPRLSLNMWLKTKQRRAIVRYSFWEKSKIAPRINWLYLFVLRIRNKIISSINTQGHDIWKIFSLILLQINYQFLTLAELLRLLLSHFM